MYKWFVLELVSSSYFVFAFFQDISTPTKRKQFASAIDSNISLTPRKKLRPDLPASPVQDSPRKTSLRLRPQTLTQAEPVRLSPRKTVQPPSTPTRGQTKAETPKRGSKVRHMQEDGAQITQRESVGKKELKRDVDMLATLKSCERTQVMWKQLFVMQLKIVRPPSFLCLWSSKN